VNRAGRSFACAVLSLAAGASQADATRTHAAPVGDVAHAWALLVDTSAAAAAPRAARVPYVATRAYSAPGCVRGRIYWRRGGGPPPACDSTQWVDGSAADAAAGLRCAAAGANLRARGWHSAGRLRQWDPQARQWQPLEAGAQGAVECEDDRGVHGAANGRWHAADGASAPWSADAADELAWDDDAGTYTLYTADYVAWWHGAGVATLPWHGAQTEAVPPAIALHGGPTALLRHSWNAPGDADAAAEGGMVVLAGARGPLVAGPAAALLRSAPVGGGAPLAETLDEAARLFRADPVRFGIASRAAPAVPQPSVAAARSPDGERYASPLVSSCSRAHVTVLAAGAPGQDANVATLPWPDGAAADCDAASPGHCAARFSTRLAGADASPQPGRQRFATFWHVDPRSMAPGAAWTGRLPGRPLRPTPADALAATLADEARSRLRPGALAAPAAVSPQVAAIVAQHGQVVAALVVPGVDARWSGGLRRLRIDPRTGAPLPSSAADDARWPDPSMRRVYTDLAGPALAAPENRLAADNARLDAGSLGLVDDAPGPRAALLDWTRGFDVDDADGDGDRAEGRAVLGAVLGAPAIVRYPGDRSMLYAGSGDGVLHAFDAGLHEAWAYVPREFLRRLPTLREAGPADRRLAGIDGDLRVLATDRNADGRIDAAAGERAILLFGLRRGGRAYFALDVSVPSAPRRLWSLTPRELPGLAQTWAAPVGARLTVAGARQNADRLVVLLAGGHDPSGDRGRARARDRIGATLYLVDALSGALLWQAAGDRTHTPDLHVDGMTYGIAATPRAVDLDGDGELDRAYVADTGGQVFRIEFARGQPRRSLARATRLAVLGGVGAADRRFYAEPDVALVRRGPGSPYAAVTLGSGFAPEPTLRGVVDRLYSLRDPLPGPYRIPPSLPPITDADLPDATAGDLPRGARGWKRRLDAAGERVLVPARTIDHAAYATTWTPPTATPGADCVQPPGTNRLRVVDVRDGRPRAFRVIEAPDDDADVQPLPPGGAAPPLTVVRLPAPERCAADCRTRVAALVGVEPVTTGWPGLLIRAGWAERGIE
jgi:type IV pilus assembly protein PilY1